MVLEFKHILQTFLSFLQREKFSKLKKLREGQRNLPIAVYREEILTTLEQNQVINRSLNKRCLFGNSAVLPSFDSLDLRNIGPTQKNRCSD